MNLMLEIIDSIQENVFDYKISELQQNITNLIREIDNMVPLLNDYEMQVLNNLLKYINIGMENQDYLFVADILYYDFKAFINSKIN